MCVQKKIDFSFSLLLPVHSNLSCLSNTFINYFYQMLKLSSVPNEYYLGGLPGQLQYEKEAQEISDCELPENGNSCGYELCEHSRENLQRAMPLSQQTKQWKIVLMMRKECGGEIWMKTALKNVETGKIALITSTNDKQNLERRGARSVRTVDGTWVVGHYRMSAPIAFWGELKNRILY